MKKTPFIVLDGLDGCGKGTQLRLLEERAQKEGKKVLFTREPGGVQLSEAIRTIFKSTYGSKADAFTQFLLMWAARNEWMKKLIIPQLTDSVAVFADRSDSSTLAYQIFAKQAHELEAEFWRMRKVVFGEYEPSLYIILDVTPEVARKRSLADSTHDSDFDAAPIEWYERVREGFQAFAKKLSDRVVVVDGSGTPAEIQKEVYRVVAEHCKWE